MESSAAGAATIELQQDSRSTSGSGIIHQPSVKGTKIPEIMLLMTLYYVLAHETSEGAYPIGPNTNYNIANNQTVKVGVENTRPQQVWFGNDSDDGGLLPTTKGASGGGVFVSDPRGGRQMFQTTSPKSVEILSDYFVAQPLLLRGRNALAGAGNLEDPASSATSMRMSRIQWMEGTVINSCMGRRRVNCCGVYPDIVVERRLSSTLSSSSSPSSSSSSSDNEDTEEIPKAYRCSRHCCGHPIVTFPQTLHDQSDINAQSSQFRTSQYDFRVKESTEKENNRQNATEKINDSEEVTTEF